MVINYVKGRLRGCPDEIENGRPLSTAQNLQKTEFRLSQRTNAWHLSRGGYLGRVTPMATAPSRGVCSPGGQWIPVPYVDEHRAELIFRHKLLTLLRDRDHG
jgi:hypothetical protein